MRRQTHWRISELALLLLLQLFVRFVLQEPCAIERIAQVLFEAADVELSRRSYQHLPQIQLRLLSIKTAETLHQHGRDDERSIRVAVRIADQKARTTLHRRGHEIQIH